MNIVLENIGRRFNREWIFRELNYTFKQGCSYAILGPNGAGKSTLLQVIAGSLSSSSGVISYSENELNINPDFFFKYLSLAAPYLELIEELTLKEHIEFHFQFKKYRNGHQKESIIDLLGMHRSENKAIKHFSSGMKQRLKLGLAFCSETPVLLLDEPTSNLDQQGIDWYLSLVEEYSEGRTLIISSNQEHEHDFCELVLNIEDYKTVRNN